jgi:hypothetical protein
MERALFSSNSDEWATPQEVFQSLNDEFHFTLDPCATDRNHKCAHYYTQEDNGLQKDWGGEIGILQSSLQYHRTMGPQMLSGRNQKKHNRCPSNSFTNRHKVFPQLHLPKIGDPFSQRAFALQ